MNGKIAIFEKIEKFHKLETEIRRNIEILYIFKDRYKEINIILITNEREVFCVGHNRNGVLGFGHSNYIAHLTINKEFTDNEQFRDKQIVEFKNSEFHTIARTSDGKLLCCGNNLLGCLGNGRDDRKTYKPELNEYLINETIIDMCCGFGHTLVLTSNKEVYAWGDNEKGQIGNKTNGDVVSIPFKINEFKGEKVDAISCGFNHSMALTESGLVYIWGNNNCGQLGLSNTSMSSLQMTNQIKYQENELKCMKISCGKHHSILLTPEKDIYAFGRNKYRQLMGLETNEKDQVTPIRLNLSEKFIDIESHYQHNISAARSENKLKYYIWGKYEKEKFKREPETQLRSFYEVFVNYLQITHKTWNSSHEIDKERIERRERPFSYNGRYKYEFEEKEFLGEGSFGKVYKVINLLEEQSYAMKIIDLSAPYFQGMEDSKKECLKEVRVMLKLKSDYVVHYITSWIEYENLFYIQMELCYNALKEVLQDFNRKQNDILNPIEYYISSELFKETLEALKYLHSQNPPIIHRDLNTANILITKGINGRFVKLADFGKAVFHNFKSESHTSDQGNREYMAPEVLNDRHYDTKSDVYSLGFTAQKLFNIEINTFENIPIHNRLLKERYKTVYKDLIPKMMDSLKDNRPDCEQLLNSKKSWYLDWDAIKSDSIEQDLKEQSVSIEENFYKYFIKTKLNHKRFKPKDYPKFCTFI